MRPQNTSPPPTAAQADELFPSIQESGWKSA